MKSLVTIIAGALILIGGSGWRRPTEVFRFNYENVLGTSLELKIAATDETAAEAVEIATLNEIDRLNLVLSSYSKESEFSQWQRTRNVDVKVSHELFEVLDLFDIWQQRTNGALNAAASVAGQIWQTASLDKEMPSDVTLQNAVRDMQEKHWSLDHTQGTARHLTDEPLIFNSFVKSYIINKAAEYAMTRPGVTGIVVNIGGDMVVAGDVIELISISNPKADAENDLPLSVIALNGKAIATSGNYRRGYQINDQWFSHILDPRTAEPAQEIISATVVATNAADAGALATAFNILDPSESADLAEKVGADFMLISADGQIFQSDGWATLERELPEAEASNLVKPADFELTIELELAHFEGRVRRPFVAVWVENSKKQSVRSLAVWYNKPRWLPDLKRWYNKNYDELGAAGITSISSATRSPGKYTLKWDGLDQSGKPVPSGTYTIYIEAAREHGTYQLMKQEIEWNNKPKRVNLTGGVEISSASIDYHKVTASK